MLVKRAVSESTVGVSKFESSIKMSKFFTKTQNFRLMILAPLCHHNQTATEAATLRLKPLDKNTSHNNHFNQPCASSPTSFSSAPTSQRSTCTAPLRTTTPTAKPATSTQASPATLAGTAMWKCLVAFAVEVGSSLRVCRRLVLLWGGCIVFRS